MTRREYNIGRNRGFTLVELLVVMGLIALIFVLVMPAIGTARQAAARSQARQQMNDLVTAMLAYQQTYGRFPLQDNFNADRVYTDDEYIQLIAILRAQDPGDGMIGDFNTLMSQQNPNRTVFLSVDDSRIENGVLVDPWQRRISGQSLANTRYQIAADWTRNNEVNTGTSGHETVHGRAVVAWSYGHQGEPGSAEGHVRSWAE